MKVKKTGKLLLLKEVITNLTKSQSLTIRGGGDGDGGGETLPTAKPTNTGRNFN